MTTNGALLNGFGAPAAFTLETVGAAPTNPGVHVVLDDKGDVIYVGHTGNLRRRLREHLQGDRQASVLHEQVGALLDRDGHTATVEEVREWLGHCTVRWRLVDDPPPR